MEQIKYSHKSNGNPKSQSGKTKSHVRYDNEPTGEMSDQDLMSEGVSTKEPFDYQGDGYGMMRPI